MNSLILISPYKGSGFKPILFGKREEKNYARCPMPDRQPIPQIP